MMTSRSAIAVVAFEEFRQGLGDQRRDALARRSRHASDPSGEDGGQLHREHHLRPGGLHHALVPGSFYVAARLALGEPMTSRQRLRGVHHLHPAGQQLDRGIHPFGHLIGPSSTTRRHDTYILPLMSLTVVDLATSLLALDIGQSDVELEVRYCVGGVLSPLLANIFLHAFDRAFSRRGLGELVRYADDFVVLCRSARQAERSRELAAALLGELGLELHPDKTRLVDLREGKEGFDFLGCHFHARMSGKLWEQRRVIRYYLHRWPSQRSMKRARARVKALTARSQVGQQLEDVIGRLNLFLRGWGNYFRTGNAGDKFVSLDRYVAWRLRRLLVKKRGRNLHAGQWERWTRTWFHDQGLHQLMGTIRYPKAA